MTAATSDADTGRAGIAVPAPIGAGSPVSIDAATNEGMIAIAR